jgi:hypothetical protein
MTGEVRAQPCEDCGSPLDEGQRYCVACGARVGERSPQLDELLRRARAAVQDGVDPAAGSAIAEVEPAVAAADADAGAGASPPGVRLPAPRVSALLVLVFLGFGILIGNVARSPVNDSLASTRSPLKVVLPASEPTSTASASAIEPAGSGSSDATANSEPPPLEPEATPEPATTTRASTAPARTPASATSGPDSSGNSKGGFGSSKGGFGSSKGGFGSSEGGSGSSEGSEPAADAPAKKLPPIKHVFVIMLSDEPYASVFGPSSAAPFLSGTLEHKGELLVHYDAVAHEELADEAALISGQGPTAETVANCPNYTEIAPAGAGADEQVTGAGCVYPRSTQTLAGQLAAKHLSWRAYVQGIDEAGATQGACAHPSLGQLDSTSDQTASSGAYATFRNPFVYFDSILDTPECAADDIGLAGLKGDLASAKRTPSFAYIAPDRCHDGNPTPCSAGAPAGLAQADTFLEEVVPEIMGSKAYKESGLLVITVDQAPSSGELADSSSCCGQPLFPNAPATTLSGAPRGGGAVGALLLSPYIKAGSTTQAPFNHFSLLRTIEDLFGLGHLGYAALSAVKSFEPAMFTAGKA